MTSDNTSIDENEIAKFSIRADEWWDPHGSFRPLHKLNPTRCAFIRARLARHFARDIHATMPLAGLKLLDIGCGGGLLSEPMAQWGAHVTGVDAAEKNIHIARAHAQAQELDIDYRHIAAEDLVSEGIEFDVILNMEVIEHVADISVFMSACGALLSDNGIMILATLNRTIKAWGLAIMGAEYILGWLPRGTHDWRKFVTPAELEATLCAGGMHLVETHGVSFNPLRDSWSLSGDLSVNYIAVAQKAYATPVMP